MAKKKVARVEVEQEEQILDNLPDCDVPDTIASTIASTIADALEIEPGQNWTLDCVVPRTLSQNVSSPFKRATTITKRLKMLLYGASGTGKTTFALQFPAPVIIDLEHGTDMYGQTFQFDVMHASTTAQVWEAVEWLATQQHAFRTLVIDPVSIFYEQLQEDWSNKLEQKAITKKKLETDESYDLKFGDWRHIKNDWKAFLRKLLSLDMNVILIAREKVEYLMQGGELQKIGTTFDCEKNLPYVVDLTAQAIMDGTGNRKMKIFKVRCLRPITASSMPLSYDSIREIWGEEAFERGSSPLQYATSEQLSKLQELLVVFPAELVQQRLAAYGAETIEELTMENARLIIEKLQNFKG